MTREDRHPVYRRRRALVIGIVAWLADQTDPIPWDDVLQTFRTEDRSWRTVENTIRDLVSFGAVHVLGRPRSRGGADTRALVATPLGIAWLDAELVPLPGEHDQAEEAAEDLAQADEIASHLAEELIDEIPEPNPLAP